MTPGERALLVFAALCVIAATVVYVGTHVDCGKIPLIGTACITH